MKKIMMIFAVVLMGCSAVANAQTNEEKIPEAISDDEAKRQSIAANQKIAALKQRLNRMIKEKHTQDYAQWHQELTNVWRQWPNFHLKNRAVFPYQDCKNAMGELLTYGMLWQQGRPASAGSTALKNFKTSEAKCAAAIKKPDLSLKDLQ